MLKRIRKRPKEVGLPPGTLISSREEKAEKVRITIMDYGERELEEKDTETNVGLL